MPLNVWFLKLGDDLLPAMMWIAREPLEFLAPGADLAALDAVPAAQ